MRIGILGTADENRLSPETCSAVINTRQALQGAQCRIDLILPESGKGDFAALPCDSVLIYNRVTGSDAAGRSVRILTHYGSRNRPSLMIVAAGPEADRIVPAAASRLGIPGFLQCDTLWYDGPRDTLKILKPVYGGNATAHYSVKGAAVISLKPDKRKKTEPAGGKPEVEYVDLACRCDTDGISRVEREHLTERGLEDSDFVVVCGKGVGSKDAVEEISCWAASVGAAVGGTKKVIEHGWLPVHQMVGQTGRTITPETCLVLGASGATPFVNGITGSGRILAVNSDPEARIFDYADFGIVEDCRVVTAELLSKLTAPARE